MTRNMQKTLPWHFNYAFAASNQADRAANCSVWILHTTDERGEECDIYPLTILQGK